MGNTFNENWVNAARNLPAPKLMHLILVGATPAAFEPDLHILREFELDETAPLRILDFGAGMLRNTVGLLEMSPYWHVTAYDADPMLHAGASHFYSRLLPHRARLALRSDWEQLRQARFDVIIAILVLQHLPADTLRDVLPDLKRMGPFLGVWGRRSLDDCDSPDWTALWPIVGDSFKPVKVIGGNLMAGGPQDHVGGLFVPKEPE